MMSLPRSSTNVPLNEYCVFKSARLRTPSSHRLHATIKRHSATAMPSRLGSRQSVAAVQQTPRHVKKVAVPVVPETDNMKYGTCQDKQAITEDSRFSRFPNALQQTNVLMGNAKQQNNCSMHSGSNADDEYMSCTASLSSSSLLKQRALYATGPNTDNVSYSGCHRNSIGSSSSHGSSSGFESMKSGSSHVCSSSATPSSSSNNASFMGTLSAGHGLTSNLGIHDSPESHLSMQDSSSGGASPVSNNITVFDNSRTKHIFGYNVNDVSKLSVSDMVLKGMPEAEIIALWLDNLGYSEYLAAFLTQGYDLSTIARITPEDLIALGIVQPAHRKHIISEIHRWRVTDSWPTEVPSGDLRDWLPLISLPEYIDLFEAQGYYTVSEVQSLTWEDFEDIGIKKLGHMKRLSLAIKKLKGHHFCRIQQKESEEKQLVTISLHHNRTNVQASSLKGIYNGLQPRRTPPPPAPTSNFHVANSDGMYGHHNTWKRRSHPYDSNSAESYPEANPHFGLAEANEILSYSSQECKKQSSIPDLNELKTKTVQLSLHSSSLILSDNGFQKHVDILEQLPVLPAKVLSSIDNSVSSDSEDYPPPPAPLACEGSIRFLRSAFHESSMTAGAGPIRDNSNLRSLPLNEQLPFANDNCGTIKSREDLPALDSENRKLKNNAFSQPCTTSQDVQSNFVSDAKFRSYSTATCNGDVLNDIDNMLQNLTDELDAMLLPSRSMCSSCKRADVQGGPHLKN